MHYVIFSTFASKIRFGYWIILKKSISELTIFSSKVSYEYGIHFVFNRE